GAGNEELFRVLEGFPDLRFGKYSLRLRASAKRVSRVPTSASALSLTPTTAPTIPLECEHRSRCVPSRSVLRQGSADVAIAAHLTRQLEELGRLDTRSAVDLAQQVADDRNNLVQETKSSVRY